MPQTLQRPASSRAAGQWRAAMRSDQMFFTALGVVFLSCATVIQGFTFYDRKPSLQYGEVVERSYAPSWSMSAMRTSRNLVREDPESERTLSSLSVTFPRLTFGGLRGLVSTVLWLQAEDDKNERRWVDLETKYDLIGAMQPYFASVYTYHAWNQAYNLSAQFQEEDTKYKWVLDGLGYLYKGEDFNPGNPNIIYEEARMYSDKLGNAFEKVFYRQHWRNDQTRLYEVDLSSPTKDDATVSLQRVYQVLTRRDSRDGSDYLHVELMTNPARPASPAGWGIRITDPRTPIDGPLNPGGRNIFKYRTDNKRPTEPMDFRYGVSPFYFSYVEFRRCLTLPQGPSTSGRQVIDSWPAMSLRLWCMDDLYYTYDTMRKMFGESKDADPTLLSNVDIRDAKIDEMHVCYRNVQMLAPEVVDEFNDHFQRYPYKRLVHTKHIEETQAVALISKAENELLDTLLAWHLNGRKMNKELIDRFNKADQLYKDAYVPTLAWVNHMYPIDPNGPINPDRFDFEQYASSLQQYSHGIEALLSLEPGKKPDLSFLELPVVEK